MMITTALAPTSRTTPTTPAVRSSCRFQNLTNASQLHDSASGAMERALLMGSALGAAVVVALIAGAGAAKANPRTADHKDLRNCGIRPIPWIAPQTPAGARASIAFFGGLGGPIVFPHPWTAQVRTEKKRTTSMARRSCANDR